jgi:tRNA(Ile)-lysidine synthase
MAARDLRYTWFQELCQEHGFDVLAVAHNANDNAETLMLNLLRGTGLNGLHGMAEVTDWSVQDHLPRCLRPLAGGGMFSPSSSSTFCRQNRLLYRPLLGYTRKQIEGYVLTHRVPYRHDSSNFESDYRRNRIRNDVFPVFETINPSFVRTLNREIGYFSEAGSIVEDWCRSQLARVLTYVTSEHACDALSAMSGECVSSVMSSGCCESGYLRIDAAALLETPHWRYLLYYILEPYGFNSSTLASIESLLASDRTVSGKRFESPTHILHTAQDSLIVVGKDGLYATDEAEENPPLSADYDYLLSDGIMVVRGAGIYNFNGSRFSVELLDRTPDMPLKQPVGTLILDADKLQFPFVCRKWRQGDWLIPLGMRGKKKVSDLFTDLKFNTLQKDAAIILVDTCTDDIAEQQHIAGLLGIRIDDRYKVTSSTRTVLRLSLSSAKTESPCHP